MKNISIFLVFCLIFLNSCKNEFQFKSYAKDLSFEEKYGYLKISKKQLEKMSYQEFLNFSRENQYPFDEYPLQDGDKIAPEEFWYGGNSPSKSEFYQTLKLSNEKICTPQMLEANECC